MKKYVMDVGNCGPDHSTLDRFLTEHYDIELLRAHQLGDSMSLLSEHPVALVLINRKLDVDYSDGLDILKQIKGDSVYGKIPVMLITNHVEYQQESVSAGGEYGFGKLQLNEPSTLERLDAFLDRK